MARCTIPTDAGPTLPLVVKYASGTSSDEVCLMEAMGTFVYDSGNNEASAIDPMGNVSAVSYNSQNLPVATYQGQAVPVASGMAAFENVPQAPGLLRTVYLYVNTTDTTTSHYSITDDAGTYSVTGGGSMPSLGSYSYAYDVSSTPGTTVTTSQGQSLAATDSAATFSYLRRTRATSGSTRFTSNPPVRSPAGRPAAATTTLRSRPTFPPTSPATRLSAAAGVSSARSRWTPATAAPASR